jgi:hypothetical protein
MNDKIKKRVGRLRTVGEVIHELGRLYREARRGDIESIEAFRLASVLNILRACVETGVLEARLDAIEEKTTVTPFRPRLVK